MNIIEVSLEYATQIMELCLTVTNTVIRTRHTPIADHDFDGYVYGTGNISRESDWVDITGYWYDSDYAKHETK